MRVNNYIHETAIISNNVKIGVGNYIGPFVVINDGTVIGNYNWIGSHAILGAVPEVRSVDHFLNTYQDASNIDATNERLLIGNNNVFREGVQIHRGWKENTVIGDGCFIMNQSYVAHDCNIANNVTMASSTLLAGHVVIGEGVNFGLGVKVHQFRKVAPYAMVGMGSVVTKDLPFGMISYGIPAESKRVNRIGLERNNFSEVDIEIISSEDLIKFSNLSENAKTVYDNWLRQ